MTQIHDSPSDYAIFLSEKKRKEKKIEFYECELVFRSRACYSSSVYIFSIKNAMGFRQVKERKHLNRLILIKNREQINNL